MRTRDLPTCPSAACTLLYKCVTFCFFFGLRSCPLSYVRTSCVSRDPVSYIVSAYLVSYCLLVRQLQRFTTLHSKQHRFFWWDVSKKATSPASVYTALYICRVFLFFFGCDVALCRTHVPRVCRVIPCTILLVRTWYQVSYCLLVPQKQRIHLHSKHQFFSWDVSKTAPSAASVDTARINKHTNRGPYLHGRVDKKKRRKTLK